MDTTRMMFNWATDQGMGQGFTQEQVDGKKATVGPYISMKGQKRKSFMNC